MPNDLEKCILDAVSIAQDSYKQMTGGWWLWHGPESFLQTIIAQEIKKTTGHTIYIDTSIQKISTDFNRGPGRPASYERLRPDISVWYKDLERLRAAIEIKRAASAHPIEKDAQKIEKYLAHKHSAETGHILTYTEIQKKRSARGL
jgi:hypothetical protein